MTRYSKHSPILSAASVVVTDPPSSTLTDLLGRLGHALGIRQQVDAAISQHPGDQDWLERQVAQLQERYDKQQGAA